MKLVSFAFESFGHEEKWSLAGLHLNSDFNLIVGRNSVGKSMTLEEIEAFAKIVKGELKLSTYIKIEVIFERSSDNYLKYELEVTELDEIKEKLTSFTKTSSLELIKRNLGDAKIYSESLRQMINISPPLESLVFHARRDQVEYPFIESIIHWSENVRHKDFSFTNLFTRDYRNSIAVAFKLKGTESSVHDLIRLGYPVESIRFQKQFDGNYNLEINEEGIEHPLDFMDLSDGFERALGLILFMNLIECITNEGKVSVLRFLICKFSQHPRRDAILLA